MSETFDTAASPPSRLSVWLLAARPKTLSAAVVPVAVGTAVAHRSGGLALGPALAALGGAVAIQIGTNFANDYFDARQGADTAERLGPTRAVQAGLLTPRAMAVATVVAFGVAVLIGLYLVAIGGWPIVAIGLASVISGVAYTAGPYALAYVGLGDLFVLVFFGFVAVCGTSYVQLGRVPELAWWAALPIGALATNVLVVNNLRDRFTDVKANKRTLAVRFGRGFAVGEYAALSGVAVVVPIALVASGRLGPAGLLPLLALPLLARRLGEVRRLEGAPLNATLAGTAQLLAVYGALLCLGLVLG